MRTPIVLSVLFVLSHLRLYGLPARDALLAVAVEVAGAFALVLIGFAVYAAGVRHGLYGVKNGATG